MATITKKSEVKVYGGIVAQYEHLSTSTKTQMVFSVFLPSEDPNAKFPGLYYLSGLTCTDQNFITKAAPYKEAVAYGIALIAPDTSPRGAGIEGEDASWDFGTGAGFYVDATEDKWKTNYNMYTYVTQELPTLIQENFPITPKKSIFGHSMGGHGAMICYLKNPGMYESCSAFAPICNPVKCPWGEKAFTGYLGSDKQSWEEYDATCLVGKYSGSKYKILIDQGTADGFLGKKQLLPENFEKACREVDFPVEVRMQDGYDHSYFFINTFVGDHIKHHAEALGCLDNQKNITNPEEEKGWESDGISLSPEDIRLGAFSLNEGKTTGWLVNAKDGAHPHIDQPKDIKKISPPFDGSVDDFVEKFKGDKDFLIQMKNKVRKCGECGKPNAFTLANCNSCGADLTATEITYTNNIFSGFLYGIAKGPFPFRISLRYQTEDFIVFDDLLQLTTLHLNTIPTTQYIPDWRWLLTKPKEGLTLIETLFANCWNVAKSQFLNDSDWQKKILHNYKEGNHVAAGFNYPPSQWQLHLQFMLPPFVPYHYLLYLEGKHFTPGRFFPIEYVRKVLTLCESKPYPKKITMDTPIEEIIDYFKSEGIDYDAIHSECYRRYGESHKELSNWDHSDFKGVILRENGNDKFWDLTNQPESIEADKTKSYIKVDKDFLQNYGRPYGNGKPSGTYYGYAKKQKNPNF